MGPGRTNPWDVQGRTLTKPDGARWRAILAVPAPGARSAFFRRLPRQEDAERRATAGDRRLEHEIAVHRPAQLP
jgi:hypothetical protein